MICINVIGVAMVDVVDVSRIVIILNVTITYVVNVIKRMIRDAKTVIKSSVINASIDTVVVI